jgi:membrane protease YdiL (CAAX protease family)
VRLFIGPDGKLRLAWRFVISFLATLAVVMFSGWLPYRLRLHGMFALLVDRAGGALMLLAIYIFLLRIADQSRRPVEDLGFPWGGRLSFIKGFLFAVSMIAVAVLAIAIGGSYSSQASPEAGFGAVVIVALTLLGGAAFEELAFRGYVFQRLCELAHPAGAILFFSALFGAIHYFNPAWSWIAFANTVLVGILFAIAYLRTRSLWVVWGMHFGWNFALGTLFGLPVSGLRIFSVLVRGEARGAPLLTGGDYGIEGSLTGTTLILLGIVLVPFIFPSSSNETAGTDSSIQAV